VVATLTASSPDGDGLVDLIFVHPRAEVICITLWCTQHVNIRPSPAATPDAALTLAGGAAASQNQLGLGRGDGRFAAGLIRQPGLGFFQRGTAQQQTAVAVAGAHDGCS
jgi:hypothetical protein